MNHGTLNERITRSLAYMLRHQPEEFDLELDNFGYAEIGDVVCALNERLGEPIEEDDVVEAIEAGDRPRYEIQEGAICALYGHSIAIDPGPSSEPPEMLYVGVGSRDAERAEEHGLRGGRRTFLHLALTEDDARETGRRIAPEYAVVTVFARRAWDEGVQFFDRHALFLSEAIPTEYLEVGEIHEDGVVRERRWGRDDGGGRGRSRGRDDRPRRRDRSRRDERPRDDDRPRREERTRDERPRDERPRSDDRPRRDERPQRDSRPAASPREEETVQPAAQREAAPSAGGSFGLGVSGGGGGRSASKSPAKADPPRRKGPPEKAPREPEPEAERHEEAGGGFGDGIF